MNLHNARAEFYVPDGVEEQQALSRITHLGIGAHHDDLEFMAFHGIKECYHHPNQQWFGGVTCTDGTGSSRTGRYAAFSDEKMRDVRREEQRSAAVVGQYAAIFQLDYPSALLRGDSASFLVDDLEQILRASQPEVVYTHNPADKHTTHLSVLAAVLAAIRRLSADLRPKSLLGCEGWRGLDWLDDGEKVKLDVSGHDHLAAALNGLFDSQIAGGKRYDLATLGRRSANATFLNSHASDQSSQLCLAMDLTPLILDDALDPVAFTLGAVDRFRDDVRTRLSSAFQVIA
ncbi:MAG: PIG-L family deacetylase [Terrimicrobiaceae bacterium]